MTIDLRTLTAAFGLWLAFQPAAAADLSVAVTDAAGRPVAFAVVMLEPAAAAGVGNWRAPAAVMKQQGVLFDPFVLPVRVGTNVNFPNLDDVRHHVYSFSSAKRFELRLYGQDETKNVVFDEPGIVPLGCNIHDNMLSYIYVTTHPVYAVTDDRGRVEFSGLGAGPFATFVWHPDLADDRNERAGPAVDLPAAGGRELAVSVDLRAVRRAQLSPREGAYH